MGIGTTKSGAFLCPPGVSASGRLCVIIFVMTSDEFREIALGFPGTEERSHINHPDFRVGGKIFATLGPGFDWGMAKLTPAEQQDFLRIDPASFKPAAGAWGERGATIITLAIANEAAVRDALNAAWKSTKPKKLVNRQK